MKRVISTVVSAALLLSLAGCGAASTTASSTSAAAVSAVQAGTYTYEETLPFGTVPWTLNLAEDGTYTLTFTDLGGQENTYTGTYTTEGDTVTTSAPNEGGDGIQASFFKSEC